eukprot:GEMP01029020.1.p1 GENE.GEMP01029020.1~~GEMP01029020.1.p1  ORF type:complete len:317 (+),score=47.47 GEMP01029020.1:173-1123(+)
MFRGWDGQWLAYSASPKNAVTNIASAPSSDTKPQRLQRIPNSASKPRPLENAGNMMLYKSQHKPRVDKMSGGIVASDVMVVHPKTYSDGFYAPIPLIGVSSTVHSGSAVSQMRNLQSTENLPAQSSFSNTISPIVNQWLSPQIPVTRRVSCPLPPVEARKSIRQYAPKQCDYIHSAYLRSRKVSLAAIGVDVEHVPLSVFDERPDVWLHRRLLLNPTAWPSWMATEKKQTKPDPCKADLRVFPNTWPARDLRQVGSPREAYLHGKRSLCSTWPLSSAHEDVVKISAARKQFVAWYRVQPKNRKRPRFTSKHRSTMF